MHTKCRRRASEPSQSWGITANQYIHIDGKSCKTKPSNIYMITSFIHENIYNTQYLVAQSYWYGTAALIRPMCYIFDFYDL